MVVNTIWTDALMRNNMSFIVGNYYNVIDLYEDFEYNSLGNFFFLTYANAMNGPLMGFNYFYNSNIDLFLLNFYHKNLEIIHIILGNVVRFYSLLDHQIPKNILEFNS